MTSSSKISTSAQLRDDIDHGRTGDKVGGFDPAAAPLGTDDEAGGTPPTAQAIAMARRLEAGKNTAHANAAEPDLAPDARMNRLRPTWIGILGGAVVAILFIAAAAVILT